jgi:FkbM family methyltransferase
VIPDRPTPAAALRTRLVLFLALAFSSERLSRLRKPLDLVLARGEIYVLGGVAPRLRLSAPHFDYASPAAFSLLTGQYEPMVQEAFRRTVRPGDVVLDIGASIGMLSLLAARLAGPSGQVIAFEPQRESADVIEAHARLNGFRTLRVIQAAAGSHAGETEMVVTTDPAWTITNSIGDHPLAVRRERVRLVAVDDLVRDGEIPPPRVVKIDVEGSELDVLSGMSRTLTELRPTLIAEMHARNVEFCKIVREHGYEIVNVDGPEPVEGAGPNVHALCRPR